MLAAALVDEGVKQVERGVPVAKVIAGIQYGVHFALEQMQMKARPIWDLTDEWLQRIAFTAGREQEDITNLVMEAAHLVGKEKLLEKNFKLSETVVSHPRVESRVFSGILLNKGRLNPQMPSSLEDVRVLVVGDALEPESLDEEALRTEAGFAKHLELKEAFKGTVEQLVQLNVGLVVVGQGVDPVAEELLTDASVIVVQRVKNSDLVKVAEHTGARMVKRAGLAKSLEELEEMLGTCSKVEEDERLHRLRITGGTGKPLATILVGAATEEVVGERERISKDAAAAVQAALRGGFIPGGGATELALARDVEKYGDTVQGMEGFGIAVVAEALQRPMAHVVANAGFNPLEKVEEVKALQWKRRSDSLGVDCDRGSVVDMIEMGVVDPLLVKYHALQAASEVSIAIYASTRLLRCGKRNTCRSKKEGQ